MALWPHLIPFHGGKKVVRWGRQGRPMAQASQGDGATEEGTLPRALALPLKAETTQTFTVSSAHDLEILRPVCWLHPLSRATRAPSIPDLVSRG